MTSGPARSGLINYTTSVSRKIAQCGVNINIILPGMFATEGASELVEVYADAFGLEPKEEVGRTILSNLVNSNLSFFTIHKKARRCRALL